MTAHGRIHFVNFARKLTVTSVLFLVPMHFLALGFSGWEIGAVISFYALAPLFVVFLFILALHWAVEGTVYSPYLREAYGLDGFQSSLYMSAGLFAMSAAAFLIGFRKFDVQANARLLLIFMALSGAGLALMVVRNVYISLAFRLLHDIADGGLGALITVAISRLFEKRHIGGSAALVLSIMIFGQMAGAMIFSPLGYRYGLRYPFLIAGGLLIVNAVYGAWLFRNREY